MIIVTGAAGFIGSCMIQKLNSEGFRSIIAVDDFSNPEKNKNLEGKEINQRIERNDFFGWLDQNFVEVEFIIHIGARTDTTEFNWDIFQQLNVDYSKTIFQKCIDYQIPLIYASSAATYGLGEAGYQDDERKLDHLHPLNPYGESKHQFDRWVMAQTKKPFYWAGLKFFNVYGPNEYHKGRMASVIWHSFNQIQETGKMKLFRSHHPDFKDGEQKRDFIYVKDVVDVCYYLMRLRKHSGIYNLGSGQARTFLDLTHAVFNALGKEPRIEFIDTPADIRDKYQYFTEAEMSKLKNIGYPGNFHSLEDGIDNYISKYLINNNYLWKIHLH